MINTCDDSIASWYDNGKTFVVKDTERFATEVIPDYFKHNNFSSFVRQLNFYGFRKIKSGGLRISEAATSEESKYWKFRHEKFQRGRPDLLSQIRKNTSETADKQEVEHLKSEIRDLKDALLKVSNDVTKLKSLVEFIVKGQDLVGQKHALQLPEVASKKLKVVDGDHLMPISSSDNLTRPSVKVITSGSNANDFTLPDMKSVQSDAMIDKRANRNGPMPVMSEASLTPLPIRSHYGGGNPLHGEHNALWPPTTGIPPASTMAYRNESISGASIDDDLLASLLALDDDDDLVFMEELDSVVPQTA